MTATHKKTLGEMLDLPPEKMSIGPGTVPTSVASAKKTSMKEVAKELRKASRAGLFDKAELRYFCD